MIHMLDIEINPPFVAAASGIALFLGTALTALVTYKGNQRSAESALITRLMERVTMLESRLGKLEEEHADARTTIMEFAAYVATLWGCLIGQVIPAPPPRVSQFLPTPPIVPQAQPPEHDTPH